MDNLARDDKGGKRREWTTLHKVTGVENPGVDNAGVENPVPSMKGESTGVSVKINVFFVY